MSGRALFRLALSTAVLAALAGPARAEEPASPGPAAPPAAPATPSLTVALPAWMPLVVLTPGLDVIAAYSVHVTPAESGVNGWFHAFDLERALASLEVRAGPAAAKVAVEGVYSTSEGALTGVAGNSVVMRVREARAGYRQGTWLSVDIGIVPVFTIPALDSAFGLRALGPVSLEREGLGAAADLGIAARVELPGGYGFAGVGAYNGEGYTNRELNRGKNIEVAAGIHPFAGGPAAALTVFASYVNGSTGAGASRADRVTAALAWQGDRIRGGASFTYALGARDDGAREAHVTDLSVRGEPVERFVLAARASVLDPDTRAPDDLTLTFTGAVGFRPVAPLEAFLALSRSLPEAAARAALPGSDSWDGLIATRFCF